MLTSIWWYVGVSLKAQEYKRRGGGVSVLSESAVSTSVSIRSVIVSELVAVTGSSEEAGSVSVRENRVCAS